MTQGKLLDRVCYAIREEIEGENIFGDKINVRDTFPYNPESKTSPATAKKWASCPKYDYRTRTSIETTYDIIERDNSPFGVTIVDLAIRGNGGRAYKVVDDENRRFDLREDQLLAILKHCGITPGGRVPGSFVWGQLGSQMHMVLVGGDLYVELEKETREQKRLLAARKYGLTPSESDLKVGHIYRKRDDSMHLFIGAVKVPGNDRTLYAFVAMPQPLLNTWNDIEITEECYGTRAPQYRREKEVYGMWNELSWAQRCDWEWYECGKFTYELYKDQVPVGYYDRPANIVLMSNPKFVEDTGEFADELAAHVRENTENKHRYVNGHGDDLAEVSYEKLNGSRRELYDSRYIVRDVEREKNFRAKVAAEIITWRGEFKSRLMWL